VKDTLPPACRARAYLSPLRWLGHGLLAAGLALAAASQGTPAPGSNPAQPPCTVAYADFGRELLQALGEKRPPAFADLLTRHYGRMVLLGFDLRYPKTMLAKPDDVARLAAIADVLLDLQDRTAEWTTADPATLKSEHADVLKLRKYVAAWRSKPTTTEPPAMAPRARPCLLVLAPDRKNFVGMVGLLGLWEEFYRDTWWFDATAQFSDLRLQNEDDAQLIALEYAAPDQHGNVTLGFDMNTREKTGLLQHVAQRAAMSWCWRWLGDDTDLSFQLGLATALVVDILGMNNARSGGSGKAHSTEGQGGFIPGAPGQGGGMPVQNADSTWRLTEGQDYFARVLRQAQKAGRHEAKDSRDKYGHFLLHDQKDQHRYLVDAPFLGKVALDREIVPAAFLDDYLEFHRAYRAAFVHWLQQNGAKSKTASADRFTMLMHRLMARKQGVILDALCLELYGIPLSSRDAAVDTLERRFLTWIAESLR
jgi:hypothetical protein